MAKRGDGGKGRKRPIEQYDHKGKKRANNPPVGLVTPQTDPPILAHKTYAYDPHLDPQLVWAGKAEHTSFEIPTVSLHVHERIDPRTIIEAVRKRNGNGRPVQGYLFESSEENPPLREAIDFYRHAHNWSNRLIAGDSLLVMNSLLEKEGMGGQVQMVYFDPPYGIEYKSNFQPFVNNLDVRDGRDEDLTQEPEMIRAFRDAWELGLHSYLGYLRDRLLLARDVLSESGSVFVQIGNENVHHVREILDEVFGKDNFISQITFRKKLMPLGKKRLEAMADYLLWYAKAKEHLKYHQLYKPTTPDPKGRWTGVELPGGTMRRLTPEERRDFRNIPRDARIFGTVSQWAPSFSEANVFDLEFDGKTYSPTRGQCWIVSKEKMKKLGRFGRLFVEGDFPRYVIFHDDFRYAKLVNPWDDTAPAQDKTYVVQTNEDVVGRCISMATDPGDLVLDITCGSGTTAVVAERWGRRWITCDTSRVAITLAKQRLIAATFDYYKLAHQDEGVSSGFQYETAPHIKMKSIANNPEIREDMTREQIDSVIAKYAEPETLYDHPIPDKSRARVSGPFTVEAVPAPSVQSLDEVECPPRPADESIARSGPTVREAEWRDELLKTGIRGKGGQMIWFSRVEPLGGTRWLHADAETKDDKAQRAVISFGPDYAPLEQRQVEMAWEEARTLIPRPAMIVFAAFQFDPEAAKDIDELTKEKTGMTFLTAQMNADLLTEDLKKKRASNQSFWLIGRPDVELRHIGKGKNAGKWQAEVRGFDYYNTRDGKIDSGDTSNIAMWLLDTDYDGRSLYPRQVFFPMADETEGWAKLAWNLRAEIDPELIEAYRGTVSLPFEPGEHKRVAVKVIDDRGIESLKIVEVK